MSIYRSILKQAFAAAWQHKYLWFFGLFATLLASNFEIELVNRFFYRDSTPYDWQSWSATGVFSWQAWLSFFELAKTDTVSFFAILIVMLILIALCVALIWISIVSQVALVSNSNKALASGPKMSAAERRHDTAVGFEEGRKHFWKVLWLNVLVRLVVYGLAALTLAPLAFGQGGIALSLLYLALFIVFMVLALSVSLMAKYAIAAVIIKRQTMRTAILSAWNLFWNNWLVSLEMACVLFALSIVGSIAIIIAVLVLAIPLAVLYFLAFALAPYFVYLVLLTLGIILSVAVVIIGGSIITVIQTSSWVALYNQVSGRTKVVSKLERAFGTKSRS